ncbi:hypothetical protein WJX81_006535 [Elliptochloris bilobata]|uniref:quinolinate synthase n=1 Tax=Elliptochloris bilobata TaxID=381761 RepID=A0AAW1RUN5_9CHLO
MTSLLCWSPAFLGSVLKAARGQPAAKVIRVRTRLSAKLQRCCVVSTKAIAEAPVLQQATLQDVSSELRAAGGARERTRLLLQYARALPRLPASERTMANRVMGCTSQVWVTAELDGRGCVRLGADSDSELTRGLAAVLVRCLSGLTPEEVLQVPLEALEGAGLGEGVLTPSRTNGFLNMVEAARVRARRLADPAAGGFPLLRISADALVPQGSFAEAQAAFLEPDAARVNALVKVLAEKKLGVVAHFYMDPEVQGVLAAAAGRWPHIHVSDSLVMADAAVCMAEAGCKAVAVLGVDFMSENVRAILDEAGHTDVQVYRMAADDIGCTLAEAAEAQGYTDYLAAAAAEGTPGVHVVYINTSLRTKALAHAVVPTITCTSSNVVQTVLQAFAQVPDVRVYYGPDTYMGRNLATMLGALARLPDEEVAALHPAHTAASVAAALPRLHYYEEGSCAVHHMFGAQVTERVRAAHGDALLTAHFEVPGEMFALALEAKARGMGVVGSTQNILDFIAGKLNEALQRPIPERLQVVLGTESGMITAIVRKVQGMLRAAGRSDVDVEVVFPVASEAVTVGGRGGSGAGGEAPRLPGGLALTPGPAGGEGCSAEGGCASCPFMKMNKLAALQTVAERIGTPGEALLEAYRPRTYCERVGGRSLAAAGCEPILHMRAFQQHKRLPDALVADVLARAQR